MREPESNLDPIERLMLASREAERAGVFASTASRAARRSTSYARVIRIGAGLLSAAACLLVAVTVSQVAHRQSTSTNGPAMNVAQARPVSLDWGVFSSCLTGPGQPIVAGCHSADLDTDGDVDLADVRRFQTSSGQP